MTDAPFHFFKIQSVGRRPLSDRVYESLKAAIIKGDLPPDAKLNETEIAQSMAVSATPVREAFRRLAAEGLVEILPWKGVKVQRLSEKEELEMYQCREALEGLACRLAAQSIDAKGVRRLRKLIDESKLTSNIAAIVRLNTKLHNLILSYAGNGKLQAMLGFFYERIMLDRNITAYDEPRRRQIHQEHEAILAALADQDADRAETVMRTHVKNGFNYKYRQKKA